MSWGRYGSLLYFKPQNALPLKKRPQPYAKQLVASNEESIYNSTSSVFQNQVAPTLQGERNLNLWYNFVKFSSWCSFNFMHNILYTQRRSHWLQRLSSLFKFFFLPGCVINTMLSLNLTSCDEMFRLIQSNKCRKKCWYKYDMWYEAALKDFKWQKDNKR